MEVFLLGLILLGVLVFVVRTRLRDSKYLKLEHRPRPPQAAVFDRALDEAFAKAEDKQKGREPPTK
jgi:hypothetical protein